MVDIQTIIPSCLMLTGNRFWMTVCCFSLCCDFNGKFKRFLENNYHLGTCHFVLKMDLSHLFGMQCHPAAPVYLTVSWMLDGPCFKLTVCFGGTSGIVVLLLLSTLCLSQPPHHHPYTYPPTQTHMHMYMHTAHPYPQWVAVCLLRCLLALCSDELLCRL